MNVDLSDFDIWASEQGFTHEERVGAEITWEEMRHRANKAYRANEIKWLNIVSKLRNELDQRNSPTL